MYVITPVLTSHVPCHSPPVLIMPFITPPVLTIHYSRPFITQPIPLTLILYVALSRFPPGDIHDHPPVITLYIHHVFRGGYERENNRDGDSGAANEDSGPPRPRFQGGGGGGGRGGYRGEGRGYQGGGGGGGGGYQGGGGGGGGYRGNNANLGE